MNVMVTMAGETTAQSAAWEQIVLYNFGQEIHLTSTAAATGYFSNQVFYRLFHRLIG